MTANVARGEAALRVNGEAVVLRPSFAALVAAEGELGPLFALVVSGHLTEKVHRTGIWWDQVGYGGMKLADFRRFNAL